MTAILPAQGALRRVAWFCLARPAIGTVSQKAILSKDGPARMTTNVHLLRPLNASRYCAPTAIEAAQVAARFAQDLLHASGASVTRAEGEELVYIVAIGAASKLLGRRSRTSLTYTGLAMRAGKPRHFIPERAPLASQQRAKETNFACGMLAPLMLGDQPIGTIGVSADKPAAFTDDDLETLAQIARLLALRLGALGGGNSRSPSPR
jgi:transcriptional regulator with GAF, ATPase, and Fis domain